MTDTFKAPQKILCLLRQSVSTNTTSFLLVLTEEDTVEENHQIKNHQIKNHQSVPL